MKWEKYKIPCPKCGQEIYTKSVLYNDNSNGVYVKCGCGNLGPYLEWVEKSFKKGENMTGLEFGQRCRVCNNPSMVMYEISSGVFYCDICGSVWLDGRQRHWFVPLTARNKYRVDDKGNHIKI